jgi:hypothetical protein
MFTVEFLGSPPQANLSEAANPCLRARELLIKDPHDSGNSHCIGMFEDALCFARMNGTSIFKRLMHIMKEDKVLPGLPPEEMECKLCREAEPEGVPEYRACSSPCL